MNPRQTTPDPGEARDPVCGMRVEIADHPPEWTHQGHRYFFCCEGCRSKFAQAPDSFIRPEKRPETAVPVPAGTPHTCPMHPEVRTPGPGSCPLCGMALEPLLPTAGPDGEVEIKALTRRFWTLASLTLPVLVIAMAPETGFSWPTGFLFPLELLEATLASLVVLWGGAGFFRRGYEGLVCRSPNMYTLIGLGSGITWAYSLVAFLAPGLFPPSFRGAQGQVATYFESAAVIVTLVTMGDLLELAARGRTASAIRSLIALAPPRARRIDDGGHEEDVVPERIQVGDRLRVRPGEKVAVDGTILEGCTHLDESMLTGEPTPVPRGVGEWVSAGTVNQEGTLVIRAGKVGSDTTLSRIVARVAEAQRTRAPAQRMADRVAAVFVPAVVATAALSLIAWTVWGPAPAAAHGLIAAVSVLIIACPCALGLATPLSIRVASGRGAHLGILFRDAAAIEDLGKVDTIVMDKTGTLTEGHPRLTHLEIQPGFHETTIRALAAGLEAGSEHPLARALTSALPPGVERPRVSEFRAWPGLGVTGRIDGQALALGNEKLLRQEGVDPRVLEAPAERERLRGATVLLLAVDRKPAALLAVEDPIRPEAQPALASLRRLGLRIVMATGDAETTARSVAGRLEIDPVVSGLSPADKADLVGRLKAQGRRVAMAGDGINDAPALAAADVGLALGTGTDIAIESAPVTLMGGDLGAIGRAIRLSRATRRNIRGNLAYAFLYNGIGVPLAAGLLYPVLGLVLSPMIAALAMSLSSVSVVMNALRLRSVPL